MIRGRGDAGEEGKRGGPEVRAAASPGSGWRKRKAAFLREELRDSFAESELPLSFREREVNLDVG